MENKEESYGIEKIFELLENWRKLPKYQLERRIDIFFALYLKEIINPKIDGKIILIIPEFPLKQEDSYRSNNADYAIFTKKGENIKLYLVELKTDNYSIDESQIKYYKKAIQKTIKEMIKEIGEIRYLSSVSTNPNRRKKYENLIKIFKDKNIIEDMKCEEKKVKVEGRLDIDKKVEKVIYILPKEKDLREHKLIKDAAKEYCFDTYEFSEIIPNLEKSMESKKLSETEKMIFYKFIAELRKINE